MTLSHEGEGGKTETKFILIRNYETEVFYVPKGIITCEINHN